MINLENLKKGEVLFLQKENQKLKAACLKLKEAADFYKGFLNKDNYKLIFDNENDSRAQVYEKYKESSIGDFGVKAHEVLNSRELKDVEEMLK